MANRLVRSLKTIDGLDDFVDEFTARLPKEEKLFMMEFALHGMAEYSLIGKQALDKGTHFKDLVSSMFSGPGDDDDEDDHDTYGFDFDDDDDDNGKPF